MHVMETCIGSFFMGSMINQNPFFSNIIAYRTFLLRFLRIRSFFRQVLFHVDVGTIFVVLKQKDPNTDFQQHG